MADSFDSPTPAGPGITLSLPFSGRWLATNSPARRVPSHGTDLMGEGHAIDFTGVDDRHRTADQPHVHVQAMDRLDLSTAKGLPVLFRQFREWPRGTRRGARRSEVRPLGLPQEGAVVEPFG